MVVRADTTFAPGVYRLPNGVTIGASGVTLDLNGATLAGAGYEGFGITCIGQDRVTIRGGIVRGYFYGVRVERGSDLRIEDNDLSYNWADEREPLPFLDINAGPDLGDRRNLGGGLILRDVRRATVAGNTMRYGENGIDLYFVTASRVCGNVASDNIGWGIHLHRSSDNVIDFNVAERCTRPGLLDSAGVLAVMGSDWNAFVGNSLRGGGDGLFIGNEHGCPSNDNVVLWNDGSAAGANAFEATFSRGNLFLCNAAEASRYGFWLGYSHSGNVLSGNRIWGNRASGIEIEHGQSNVIEGNEISGNGGHGIVLRTDGAVHFPRAAFPCLGLPDPAASRGYIIRDNVLAGNRGGGIELIHTTDSTIVDNLIADEATAGEGG